ncbi:MAG TPA: hypothetical protein VFE14_08560 [Micromonosporaceae bacterium]|nr:hypothetical protein [Micromonosporaceae bacterium]
MLNGLGEVDWSGLTHAYGPATDIPDLIRALAATDVEPADHALDEIISRLFHQGTVYPATVPAVPFLVELAATGSHHRAAIAALVGMLADPHHADGVPLPAVRAALVARAGQLLPLLHDPDADVRAMATYAVAQCGDAAPAGVLWRRWEVETSPEVRASLALALGLRDPDGSAGMLRSTVVSAPARVRVAAALAILRTAAQWPAGAPAGLAEAFAAGEDVDHVWQHRHPALDELVAGVDDTFAADLLGRLLADPVPDVRRAALWALSERCRVRRCAPRLLVPMLAPALADPDDAVVRDAVGALRRAGAAAGLFADELTRVARDFPRVAGGTAITAELLAVQTLVLLADPRWLDPVCAAWAAGHQTRLSQTIAFDPVLLDAVRRRLAAHAGDAGVAGGLIHLLRRWGPAAAAAEPELLAVLPLVPREASTALAAIGVAAPAAVPHLRDAALAGDVAAGVALWHQAGDAAPLVAAVERQLDTAGALLAWRLTQAAPASAALGPVLARLRGHLTGEAAATYPQREVQICAARIVWRATGRAADVLPTVTAVLAAGDSPARAAAELAAEMAEPGLAPVLREQLDQQRVRVPAARALWRLGEPAAGLVPVLVTAIESGYDWHDAIHLLVEMSAVDAVPDLTRLAERDKRIEATDIADDAVWIDEQIRRELRTAVATLARVRR